MLSRVIIPVLAIVAVVGPVSSTARGDFVTMRDGRRFQGKVVSYDETMVRIDAVIAGIRAQLVLSMDEVDVFGIVTPPLKPPAPGDGDVWMDEAGEASAEKRVWTPEDPLKRDLNILRGIDRALGLIEQHRVRTVEQINRVARWSSRSPAQAQRAGTVQASLARRLQMLEVQRQRYQSQRDIVARRIWPPMN